MTLPFFKRWLSPVRLRQWVDWRSLQGRLTLSLATLMAVSLGGVTLWTTWQMRQMLVSSHQKEMATVVRQLHQDLSVYLEMFPVEDSVQRAIDKRSQPGLLMWVSDDQHNIMAATAGLQELLQPQIGSPRAISQVVKVSWTPDIYRISDRKVMACHTALMVGDQDLGHLYLAQDITPDQERFEDMVKVLLLGTGAAVLLTPLIMAYAVQRWLRPLNQMGDITKTLTPNCLAPAHIQIASAPTELQELVDQFNRMMTHLATAACEQQQVGERQRQFISNVSHELRTPLTIMRGYLQSTLRRSENLTAPQQEGLEIAASEADLTIQLLQDLLNLARADDGNMPYDLKTLVLNDVVSDVVQMAEQFSHRTILVEASAPLIPVVADANRLQQVLVNLVENALKYSDAGEPVTLKLKQVDNEVVIQVCDRGQGIPLKQQSRIFERFYRVDEARARTTGGTGLGLSIVKTFVEGMGGQVSVLSKSGEGSTFTVTLPTVATS